MKRFHYDGLIVLQSLSLFLKSVVLLIWIREISAKSEPFGMFEILHALPLHLPLYLSLLSFIFLTKRKWLTALLLNGAFSFLMFIDLLYYRAFGLPTSLFSLSGIFNLGDVGNSVIGLIHTLDIFLFVDLLLWGGIFLWIRKSEQYKSPRTVSRFSFYLFLSLFAGYVEFGQSGLLEKILKLQYKPLYAIEQAGPIGYHLADSVHYLTDHTNEVLSEAQVDQVKKWFEQNREMNQKSIPLPEYNGLLKNKNVIFIHFESLENFPLNKYWGKHELTPSINKLLKHSLYFSNIKEQVGEGNSADAEFMVFNSLYSLPQGIVSLRFPSNHFYSFPQELHNHGYNTAAFVGMEKGFMNMGVMLPNYGFQSVSPITSFKFKEKVGLGLLDAEMFPQVFKKIQSLHNPFFSYIITLTNHVPYYLPQAKRNEELVRGIKNDRVKNYLQTLHYTDQALGKFMNQLVESGIGRDTFVVIYGDHEGIHKYYKQDASSSGIPWIHNDKTIPFMIYHPSIKGTEFKQIGGQVDIVPTVEYLLGIPFEKKMNYRVGRNLLTRDKGFAVLHDGDYIAPKGVEENGERKKFRLKGLEYSTKVLQGNLIGK